MAAVIGFVSLILVIVAVITSATLGTTLESRLEEQLRDTAVTTTGLVAQRATFASIAREELTIDYVLEGRQLQGGPDLLLAIAPPGGRPSGAILTPDDQRTLSQSDLFALTSAVKDAGTATVSLEHAGSFRVLVTKTQGGTLVMTGLSRAEIQNTMTSLFTVIALATLGGLILLALTTALTISVSLRPLRAAAATATRVSTQPLDRGEVSITERVPDAEADPRTEIGRVGAALNTLLDHVDASLAARQRNEERMRRFVADASHELRTPLASIRGYSELSLRTLRQAQGRQAQAPQAQDPQAQDPQAQDPQAQGPQTRGADTGGADAVESTTSALERIQAQSIRMTRLVEDLLLLARLDEGRELVHGTVDLTRLAVEGLTDARPTAPDHVWQLDVPEEPVLVTGDAGRLHQVIANLLANARTHTPAGTTITLRVHAGPDAAELRVHDDGPGIDPGVRDELFSRFARGDVSRARQTGGTGLGLAIAKAIVEGHGGTIAVESSPGDTTFIVRLPLAASVEASGQ
ncbi:sensor histidine kinase [Microbacterium sp. EF45047]|uniref:sensor histidine kinase n=1 Tax=Microbacterium sp. EF45047 TaxID=2809708 RepID=UPI00234A763A|nr:ATP-binding protein [Microbacterium sp. EF45047]WCM56879.1 HAMP domain-containing protein [Microbacterium sp. EF45047]